MTQDPRDPHAEERRQARIAAYDDAMHYRQTAALAIVECGLCDDDGYRGARVCDHVDRADTTKRGRALVQAELDKIRARRHA